MTFPTVTLRDGTQVSQASFTTTKNNIESLIKKSPAAFVELLHKCRNPNYSFTNEATKPLLKSWELVSSSDGRIPRDVRSIILNLTQGEGEKFEFVNPLEV